MAASAQRRVGPGPDGPWVAIVANPYSGHGANRRIVARLQAALDERGLASRALWDPLERDAVLSDTDRLGDCRCVIVAGGDGTVADVLNQTTDVPVAMVPIGNENLFARQFGYDTPEQVAAAVAGGKTRRIDLGRANGRRFGMMVSVGLDADVVDRVSRWRSASNGGTRGTSEGEGEGEGLRRVTRLSYVKPMLGALAGYDYPQLTLDTGDRQVRGAHAIVFNIPQYAMGLPFVPEARDDDGLLHWVVFEKPGALALGGYLAWVALGRHLRCGSVRHGKARSLRITAADRAAVQIDGDAAGTTPVDVSIEPRAVDVIVP